VKGTSITAGWLDEVAEMAAEKAEREDRERDIESIRNQCYLGALRLRQVHDLSHLEKQAMVLLEMIAEDRTLTEMILDYGK
jgi:hypothetical protein